MARNTVLLLSMLSGGNKPIMLSDIMLSVAAPFSCVGTFSKSFSVDIVTHFGVGLLPSCQSKLSYFFIKRLFSSDMVIIL